MEKKTTEIIAISLVRLSEHWTVHLSFVPT